MPYLRCNPLLVKGMGKMHYPLDVMKIRSKSVLTVLEREKNEMHNVFGSKIRVDSTTHKLKDHTGWDLIAPEKTPIYAVMSGTVVTAWRDKSTGPRSYGYQVEIEFIMNGTKYRAFYGHLHDFNVQVLQEVSEGQVIGSTGHTGNAHNLPKDQWHLHFELREVHGHGHHLNHNSVDPAILLGGKILTCTT
jgi:murein DD-endopeptidase MepM/ murein hydrolase activator NlpD